jgi:thioredoxin reductase (NADPH)
MSTHEHRTDIVVVGAGPVGLFAVFEAGMLRMRCHVVDSLEAIGGQCSALYPEKPIYDIPGYPVIDAGQLVEQLAEQAAPFGPVYHLSQQVTAISQTATGSFSVDTSKGVTIACRAIIIAAGHGAFGPNRPPLKGIEAFEGNSVLYLVNRREDLRNKRIVIAGGGDSALDWALSLAEVASSLSIVHRRPKFRGMPESVERLKRMAAEGKIDLVTPFQLAGVEGQGSQLETVIVQDFEGNQKRIAADILLPFFGLSTNLGPIAEWGLAFDHHQIIVDPASSETNTPGIFAIGDIASYAGKLKLILTGFAEAAIAAHAIHPLVHRGEALHFEYSTTSGIPKLGDQGEDPTWSGENS